MDIAYFGCREHPFSIAPDPHFFYTNEGREKAFADLLYGVRERKGFIVLTGAEGMGKTTLLRRLMDRLDNSVRFVFFDNTKLTFAEMLDAICREFGLSVAPHASPFQKIWAFNDFLLAQRKAGGMGALLVDDAQNLSDETLENLRLLSNLESAHEKLLQIVFVGRPEFDKTLLQPHLRQLRQRIVVRCRLDPLPDHEVGPFIRYRLRTAGCERVGLFSPGAIQRIAFHAKGTPRTINVLCANALLIAHEASREQVSAKIVDKVAADLWIASPPLSPAPTSKRHARQMALTAALVLFFLACLSALGLRSRWQGSATPTVVTQLELSRQDTPSVSREPSLPIPTENPFPTPENDHPAQTTPAPFLTARLAPPEVAVTSPPERALPLEEHEPPPQLAASSHQDLAALPDREPPPKSELAAASPQTPAQLVPEQQEQSAPKPRSGQLARKPAAPRDTPTTQALFPPPMDERKGATTRKTPSPSKREEAKLKLAKQGLTNDDSTLLTSAERGDTNTLGLLLNAGASPNAKDAKGWNALMLATLGEQPAAARTLVASGADVNAKNEAGGTALMLAATKGAQDVVQTLLDNGANVNVKNREGWTPLMYATWNGHGSTVRALLGKKAEVNAKNQEGWTPLMFAASKGHTNVVQMLLNRGADAHFQNKNGETAVQLAIRRGHGDVVRLLQSAEFDE